MHYKEVPEQAIEEVAKVINSTVNRPSKVSITTIDGETETPHYFEIAPFDKIDDSDRKFFAVDGSYNFQEFYNGVCVGIYTAGYVCFKRGSQVKVNSGNDPIIKGKSYFPDKIMVTNDQDKEDIYDELLNLGPVKNLLDFLGNPPDWSGWAPDQKTLKKTVCSNTSKLFSFCQSVLEWSLIYEISKIDSISTGDFILRDGNLRSLDFEQKYIKKIGKELHSKGIVLVSITKNSAIKLHMSSTFRALDEYMQQDLKNKFNFVNGTQKLCCWLEVSDEYLQRSFKNDMIRKKNVIGGRGFGLYFVARLDYVEKLQNYDWAVADLNIYDAIPGVESGNYTRDIDKIKIIFWELTRLTQEHYILGYPYPLVDAHNFVTLKKDFKQEIINRVKLSLYRDTRMDHVDIENMFLDIHDRF